MGCIVTHMNIIHKIGNKPQSRHGMRDRWTDRVKPIYQYTPTTLYNKQPATYPSRLDLLSAASSLPGKFDLDDDTFDGPEK